MHISIHLAENPPVFTNPNEIVQSSNQNVTFRLFVRTTEKGPLPDGRMPCGVLMAEALVFPGLLFDNLQRLAVDRQRDKRQENDALDQLLNLRFVAQDGQAAVQHRVHQRADYDV